MYDADKVPAGVCCEGSSQIQCSPPCWCSSCWGEWGGFIWRVHKGPVQIWKASSVFSLSYTCTPTGRFCERYPSTSGRIPTHVFSAWHKEEVLQVSVCATNWCVSLKGSLYPYSLENTAFLYLIPDMIYKHRARCSCDCKAKPSVWCLQRSFQPFVRLLAWSFAPLKDRWIIAQSPSLPEILLCPQS